jgi:hypothetical protein
MSLPSIVRRGGSDGKTDRPGMSIGWSTPMVFRPDATRAELIVLGSTRLDAYDLGSGAQRWWLPIGSSGSMGTALAEGETLMLATEGTNEPMMPLFASVLAKYDKDKDGGCPRLSSGVMRISGSILAGSMKTTTNSSLKRNGTGRGAWGLEIGGRLHFARVTRGAGSSRARFAGAFKRTFHISRRRCSTRGVYYMVKSGGIITSLDPATGNC